MCEELAEEQLKDFCTRHGLAKDGYLDETELTTVCQCIGLQVSSEMIKDLFEELDGDKDGRVCLSELSQMFRGMQDKLPPSPERNNMIKNDTTNSNSPPSRVGVVGKATTNGFSNIPVSERGAYSILDPENTGFAKVGRILDLWSQLGIGESDGSRLLSELGFSSNSKSHSINLQDLAKSIEEEIDHSKERLPLAFQVALVTYRTEAQFIQSLCKSMECERDKLKADILDAHQRQALIAQEVDEQNARLERNSQMLIRKMELKYNEQLQDIQDRFSTEKESLQQALHFAETKVRELQDEDNKLKAQIGKLNEENTNLEKELQNLNIEISSATRTRSQLEREVSRYLGLETQLQDMERKYVESLSNSDIKLKDTYSEMQALRDQNDELSMQLESVRESLRNIHATQTKEKRGLKKRKGQRHSSHSCSGSSALSPCSSLVVHRSCNHEGNRECPGDGENVPVNKMGKYFCRHEEGRSLEDGDECDSSLEQTISAPTSINSCSSSHNLEHHHVISSTGRGPTAALQPPHHPIAIRLAACIGESSTDPIPGNEEEGDEEMESEPSISAIEERLMMGQTEKDCASLESEMCAVANANSFGEREHSRNSSRACRHFITGSTINSGAITFPNSKPIMIDRGDQIGLPSWNMQDMGIQTMTMDSSPDMKTIETLQGQISQFGREMHEMKAAYEKENTELKAQCSDLESSLQMLKEEYDKTEDYWHEKLQESRDLYEQDKVEADDRLQDLLMKIKEYDELVLAAPSGYNNGHDRLPPIEERASLERQVTDLEEECEELRHELKSMRIEQESVITTYQRSYETKLREDCVSLEQEVSALSKKCQDYESRLSALAEEERSTVEESGMMDLMKERIKHLELQLRSQDDKFRQQIRLLEATLKERETLYKKSIPDVAKPSSPQFGQNNWNSEIISQSKSKSLLEMLHSSQKPESIWPQRFASVADKSSSLPYFPMGDPAYAVQPSAWGSLSPSFQPDHASSWGVPPAGGPAMPTRKAWCHVELGWLQSLRAKLKQRDEQCYLLQRALYQKDSHTEKIVTELKYQHDVEISNWESLMQASQELLRQHVNKHKDQAEKLAHSDLLMKDLWVENAKLMAALNATEQRVIQMENLLKFQMTTNAHHHHNYFHHSSPGSPHHHGSSPNNNNNNNFSSQTNAISSAPLSLPHQSSHFNI